MASKLLWYQRFRQWFSSERGSAVMGGAAIVLCISGCSAYLIPQGLFIKKCVKWFQLYQYGFPASLQPSLQDKGNEVLKETTLTSQQKKLINFFSVYGFDVFHLGTTSTRQGAFVGLPKNFSYKTEYDMDVTDIQLRHCPEIPWETEAGKSLKQSLVLSDDAQKFAIAREIYCATYPMLHIRGIGTSAIMLIIVMLSKVGNRRFQILQSRFRVRALWYTLTCTFGWGLWACLNDVSNVYLDRRCDRHASDLGPQYLKGGIEYYEKKMLMNRTLRSLMGPDGESLYTPHGNMYSVIRTKTMPLSERLDILKKLSEGNSRH